MWPFSPVLGTGDNWMLSDPDYLLLRECRKPYLFPKEAKDDVYRLARTGVVVMENVPYIAQVAYLTSFGKRVLKRESTARTPIKRLVRRVLNAAL